MYYTESTVHYYINFYSGIIHNNNTTKTFLMKCWKHYLNPDLCVLIYRTILPSTSAPYSILQVQCNYLKMCFHLMEQDWALTSNKYYRVFKPLVFVKDRYYQIQFVFNKIYSIQFKSYTVYIVNIVYIKLNLYF